MIDPAKVADFERFASRWIELVERHGGSTTATSCPGEGYDRTFMRPLLPPQKSATPGSGQ